MVRRRDFVEVHVGQFAVHAVDQRAHLAGVDEQRLLAPVAKAALHVDAFVLAQKPQANRNLRAVEKLPRQRDHAVDQVSVDQRFADLAFARLVGRHAAVGQHKAGHAVRREVVDEVLHPRKVGVAFGRHAVLPAHVVVFAEPVGVVEGRVGDHIVGAQIGMQVVPKSVGVFAAKVGLDAAQCEVHHGEAARGRIAFLPVNTDVAELSAMRFDKLLGLHEHAAGAASRVVDAAFVRCEHFDEAAHDAARRIELAAVLAFGAGKAGQKIFVDAA